MILLPKSFRHGQPFVPSFKNLFAHSGAKMARLVTKFQLCRRSEPPESALYPGRFCKNRTFPGW
ncbi:MAG: hypothetical protein A2170_16155 [Deltaproteobacteria bacterium RBG_13_53_10]|nr:MAG: hypothetical protein A2170_16155 [Deltaproteobacteria bacterium RBG_13_53_10]